MKTENPQIIAVILSDVPFHIQRQILNAFPLKAQHKFISLFKDLKPVRDEIVESLYLGYYQYLTELVNTRSIIPKEQLLSEFIQSDVIDWISNADILPKTIEGLNFFHQRILYQHVKNPWLKSNHFLHYGMLLLSITCIYRSVDLVELKNTLLKLQPSLEKHNGK